MVIASRRSFLAAGLAVPAIITLEPSRAAELHSPPPEPHGGQINRDNAENPDNGGVLAFTGQPLDKQTITGLAAIAVGSVILWVAKGEKT